MLAAASVIADVEQVEVGDCAGRTLAQHLPALRTQPPFAASAMDGYAVRAEDLSAGKALDVIGEAAAGHPFRTLLQAGQAVRIFTGAPVPAGADTVIIQENVTGLGSERITPSVIEPKGRHIRNAGLDFMTGDSLLTPGTVLDSRHLGLAASMGYSKLPVRRKPRVAIVSTGDELVLPGDVPGEGQIVSSNAVALAALVAATGGTALDLGIVRDSKAATIEAIKLACEGSDLVVTSGGASVGEHDFVQDALKANGFGIEFWKVAIRPGKPLMFGVRGNVLCLGLPGNPVSSQVCGLIFLAPLLRRLLGQSDPVHMIREMAMLGRPLPANDLREEYMRATLVRKADGTLVATPFDSQDSSIQRLMAAADALVIRPAYAPAAPTGSLCEIIRL